MSNTYATRFRILPVEVKPNEVVIATAEPFQRDWEAEMQPILRKDIRRVISNPEEILRYQVEFYNLAKFDQGRAEQGRRCRRRFELRTAGRNGQEQQAVRRQRPAHRAHRRLALAVRLRAARLGHPRRAAARHGHRAFPHRRHPASGVPDPDDGAQRHDQPHQDSRPHGCDREAPPAGRPDQDAHAGRAGGRTAAVDAADGLRRKAGDADFRSRRAGPRFFRAGFRRRGGGYLARDVDPAQWHHPGDRAPPAAARR